jgi:hypothetical protein
MPRLIKRWAALTYCFLLCIVTPALYAQDQSNDWQPSEGLVDYFVQDHQLDHIQAYKTASATEINCSDLMGQDAKLMQAVIQVSHDSEWGERRVLVLEKMSDWFSTEAGKNILLRQKALLNSSMSAHAIAHERELLNIELEKTLDLYPSELDFLLNTIPSDNTRSTMRLTKALVDFIDRHEHCAQALLIHYPDKPTL